MKNYKELLKDINTFIFDYDGVLTDGNVILLGNGDALRTAHVKDGYALQLCVKLGYNMAIISGGISDSVQKRMDNLRIKNAYLGVKDKTVVYDDFIKQNDLKPEQVLYMGDDIPDYKVMQKVGLPCCPADASEEIKAISLYISPFKGGKGCVRDIIEQTLKIQEKWMTEEAFSW